MRLAIFGGTFDPVHCAHLEVAREALVRCALDRVLFVPASHPPHKGCRAQAPFEDRVRMLELACEGEPRFEVSRLEEGEEVSYSIHTIEKVRATLGSSDELFFLIGADAFAELPTWYRWRDVVRLVTFIVASRPGHAYQVPEGARVVPMMTLALRVSSSQLRAQLAAGHEPPEIPPKVLVYIRKRGLYRGNQSTPG
ncbi:MAG: nicotinate-nucleotide adenylyltransferase [Bryobacterales bacterium]|nr:nicotinate-nucleotide adenylyltransferase [Bryobacteraceae bacterium]MDW8130707.1 nicotinate-nucleotide adenylyltransferase [Bryobacterales bacterium]